CALPISAATSARPACRSPAIRYPATEPQSDDSHSGYIVGPVRSCRRPGDLHPLALAATCAAWSDAGAAPGRPDARKRPTHPGHGQCRPGGERGSEVSPSRLRQDQLVQGPVRNSTPEPFILLLKPLQFLQLIYAHPTILLAPAVISLFDNADPPDRIKTGQALPH